MMQRGVSGPHVRRIVDHPDRARPARLPGAKRFECEFSRRRRLAVIAFEEASAFVVVTVFWM